MDNTIQKINTTLPSRLNEVAKKQNVNFTGQYPISAITRTREVIGFESIKEAVQKTGVTYSKILEAVERGKNRTRNLVFKKTDEISDENGKIDLKKVKKFAEGLRSFCIIDQKTSNIYTPIDHDHTASILGIEKRILHNYLNSPRITKTNKILVERVSVEDEFGNLVPEKAQAVIREVEQVKKAKQEQGLKLRTQGFYAVDSDFNATRWYSVKKFAKEYGLNPGTVTSYLIRKVKLPNGLAVIRPTLVQDESGKIDLNKLKKETIRQLHTKRGRDKSKITAINRDGTVKEFARSQDISKETGFSSATISKILSGKQFQTGSGWRFVYTNKLRDNDGKILQSKIDEIRDTLASTMLKGVKKEIVAINSKGEATKFASIRDAEYATRVNRTIMSRILLGEQSKTKSGWSFAWPQNLQNENGELDTNKVKEWHSAIFSNLPVKKIKPALKTRPRTKQIIAININGETKIFNTTKEAAIGTNQPRQTIQRALREEQRKTRSGWHITDLEKVQNESGEIDLNKVKELHSAIFSAHSVKKIKPALKTRPRTKQIIAININGEAKIFDSTKEAAIGTELPRQTIQRALRKNGKAHSEWIITDLEKVQNESGEIDSKKVKKIYSATFSAPLRKIIKPALKTHSREKQIIAININGETKIFNSTKEAAIGTNLPRQTVQSVLRAQGKTRSGWVFTDLEKVQNIKGEIDQSKIQEIISSFAKKTCTGKPRKDFSIVAINKNGEVKVFKNPKAAEASLDITLTNVYRILNGKADATKSGWHFVHASKLRDETGKIPKSKVREVFATIFPNKPSMIIQPNSLVKPTLTPIMVQKEPILAINLDGRIKLYPGLKYAKIGTNTPEETVLDILSTGRKTTKDGWNFILAHQLKDETGKISKDKIKSYFLSLFKTNG